MKRIILLIILAVAILPSSMNAQANQDYTPVNKLLPLYLDVKNALVGGSAASAASGANELLRTLNSIDYKIISEGNINTLVKDAARIAGTKDLNKQREAFAYLSNNFAALAKAVRLSNEPVYKQYCPMKKTYWLSSEEEILNPYYGSAMLNCGEVVETFNNSSKTSK
jgi:hypothetical protein